MSAKSTHRYVVNCTQDCHGPYGEAITEMADAAEDLEYRDFEKIVGRQSLEEAFPDYDWRRKPKDLALKDDYAVSFHRSTWRDIPCVYVRHSAIEYIFTQDGKMPETWTYEPKTDDEDSDENPDSPNPRF